MNTAKIVYYLVHRETGRRLKYYRTLQGARIAQRLRNRHLGFLTSKGRNTIDDHELEICVNVHGETVPGTYVIVEDYIECEDLVYTE